MSDRFEAAQYIANSLRSIKGVRTLVDGIRLLGTRGIAPTPETIRTVTELDASEADLHEIVHSLTRAGIIMEGTVDSPALMAVGHCAEILVEREPQAENELVVNTPVTEEADIGQSFGSLLVRWMEMVSGAESDVVILNPFFTLDVFEHVEGPLATAARNGSDITLLTRSLTDQETSSNRLFVKKLLETDVISNRINLYEYAESTEDYAPTIHAKLTIADEKGAYLGTANLTHRGLYDNVELGVIFRDETITRLRRFARELLTSQFTHRVIPTKQGFERQI